MKINNEINQTLLLFIILIKSASCASEWVDPFNVDFVVEKRVQDVDPFTNNLSNVGKVADGACSAPSSDAMLYYKRTINLLLASVVLDEISGSYKGRLVIDLPSDDFKVLKEFTGGEINEPLMLQKINEILTNTLEMTFVDKMELAFMNWTDIWYSLLMNKTAGFMVIVLSVLFVIYRLFNAKFSKKEIVCYVGFLCYIFDFCITWKRMLQEVEINQYADSRRYLETPVDCFPDNMNGWQVFVSMFKTTTDCRQYYKTMMYDVIWDVGPLDVFAHQSRVLIQIFGNIGVAVSQMVTGLMGNFPFPLNIILLPLLMVFTLLIICIVFTYCTNTHVSVNFMHLFQFKLKKTPTRPVKYREEIQEVTPSKKITHKTKTKSPDKQQAIQEGNENKKMDVNVNDKNKINKVDKNCDRSASDKNTNTSNCKSNES